MVHSSSVHRYTVQVGKSERAHQEENKKDVDLIPGWDKEGFFSLFFSRIKENDEREGKMKGQKSQGRVALYATMYV